MNNDSSIKLKIKEKLTSKGDVIEINDNAPLEVKVKKLIKYLQETYL